MGCASRSTVSTHNSNYQEVWVGTIDAVSDRLHVEKADKEKGLLVARSDTRWVRTEALVEIVENGGQYDVSVKAKDEKLRVFLMPSGLRSGEEQELLGDNPKLTNVLLTNIKKRVARMPWQSPGAKASATQKGPPADLISFIEQKSREKRRPQKESRFEARTLEGVSYSRAFDETEIALGRHFELRYSDRTSGVTSTRYSSEKSVDGIIKLRAIAVVEQAEGDQATTVNLKIVRERFWEKWEFDHELKTQMDFDGYDKRLANAILDEIQSRAAR